MASLGWVTPGAATEGVTPLFFPEKPGDFLVASSAVSPLISCSQKLTTFLLLIALSLFIAFTRGHPLEGVTPHLFYLSDLVSPPRGCHPTPFFYLSDLVSPLFFVNVPTKIFFHSRVTPWKVTPGAVHPPMTPLKNTHIKYRTGE